MEHLRIRVQDTEEFLVILDIVSSRFREQVRIISELPLQHQQEHRFMLRQQGQLSLQAIAVTPGK